MKIGKPHNVKTLGEYNNNDVVSLFHKAYEKRFGIPYPLKHYRAPDIKRVQGAIDNYGLFAVIASAYKSLDRNDPDMTIPYWIGSITSLIPQEDRVILEIYCYMRQRDDQSINQLWRKYTITRAKWFPTAKSRAEGNEYLAQLKESLGVNHA